MYQMTDDWARWQHEVEELKKKKMRGDEDN